MTPLPKPPFQFGLGNLFGAMAVVAVLAWLSTLYPMLARIVLPFITLALIAWVVEWDHRRFR